MPVKKNTTGSEKKKTTAKKTVDPKKEKPVKKTTKKTDAVKKSIPKKIKKTASALLLETVIEAALDKKAENIVSMDLTKIDNFICKYFVICSANSNTQVKAICDNIEEQTRKKLNEKVWHKEGLENAHWILLDYADIVIHIFQNPYREFYKLEELWADAEITNYN